MRTLLNLVLFTVGLLLSVSCMKSERITTSGGGGGGGGNQINDAGTAGVLSGDQRIFKALAALGVPITNEIRDQYALSSRNVMPFSGNAGLVNPVNTYSGILDAMRIAVAAVNTGLANNGSTDNRAIFAPARAVAVASFDEAAFLETAENVSLRVLRRPLMPDERTTLSTEIFAAIKGNAAMTTDLRRSILASMVGTILVSMEGISAN